MTSLFPTTDFTLPHFRTLLIQGPFHATAPLHLCLSHLAQTTSTRAVFLTPSRDALITALREFDEDWLNVHGGHGAISKLSSKVDILYPPSPAHLMLLLSTFHQEKGHEEALYNSKITFAVSPTLFVLHEPSAYLVDSNTITLASYMTLIQHALTTIASMATERMHPALAVFDTGMDRLQLPIMREIKMEDVPPGEERNFKRYPVSSFVRRYFDWIGEVETVESNEDELADGVRRTLTLRHARRDENIVWNWSERPAASPHGGTFFSWL